MEVVKTCPPGSVLQSNGLCGTDKLQDLPQTPTWCGPQYSDKKCCRQAQLTPGITTSTGKESIPNIICAYRDGDFQYACDPGCCAETCAPESETESESEKRDGPRAKILPIWAILLMAFGSLFLLLVATYYFTRRRK